MCLAEFLDRRLAELQVACDVDDADDQRCFRLGKSSACPRPGNAAVAASAAAPKITLKPCRRVFIRSSIRSSFAVRSLADIVARPPQKGGDSE